LETSGSCDVFNPPNKLTIIPAGAPLRPWE
jgi:hypothetical protein